MAVEASKVPLTREDVWLWLKAYNGVLKDTKKLRTYLQQKIDEADAGDQYVDTSERRDIDGDRTHLVDMILMDLESYK
jgi:hypothetical protein